MNPLPNNGTKLLGIVIIVLAAVETNDQIFSLFGKWGVVISTALAGVLTTLRGIQNTLNQSAQAAAPAAPAAPAASVSSIKPASTSGSTPKSAVIIVVLATFAICGHVLQGCATTATASQDFLKALDATGTLNNAVVGSVDSLAKQKAISQGTGQAIITVTDKVQAALALANTAYAAGDQATASAKLAAAAGAVAQVQACITVPATLVTCLQGVSTP